MSVASQWNEAPAAIVPAAQRRFPVLLVLFACSGCAALIYEIVWFQSLELVIGSSAISLGILLGTFMGGMCLGSLLLPPFVSPRLHPLRVYAAVELGIGLLALLLLFGMPLVGGVHGVGRPERLWHGAPRNRGGRMLAAAYVFDGREFSADFPLGRSDAARGVLDRTPLRRQYLRSRDGQPAHRLLPAPLL